MSATHVVLGAGPVGQAVIAALLARNIKPVVVTRSGDPIHGTSNQIADMTDPLQAANATRGAEVIFQCAQPTYHRWPQQFPALQAGAAQAASSTGALLVVAENLYGYGPVAGPLTEDLPLAASTRKGFVRAQMSSSLEAQHRSGELRFVAARASDFFGPGVKASAVGNRFFNPLIKGKSISFAGNPDRLHTYTYVPDFGEAMVRLSKTPESWGKAWHVPNAPTMSTRAFVEHGASIAATSPRLRKLPCWQLQLIGLFVPAVRELVEMQYQFEQDWVVDHSRYAAILGNHATPIDQALAATIDSHSL